MAKAKQGVLIDTQTKAAGPVECLGMTFESDEARREHFLRLLKEKLPELRQRPDFPLGPDGGPAADEDILRLSDPPHYTACPNPFLAEFVEHYGRPYDPEEPYHQDASASNPMRGKFSRKWNGRSDTWNGAERGGEPTGVFGRRAMLVFLPAGTRNAIGELAGKRPRLECSVY